MSVERAQIKSSLYLMDTVSYIGYAMSNLSNETECSDPGANCGGVWQGEDPAQNIPSYLNPYLNNLPAVLTDLPSNPTVNDIKSHYLNDPSSNSDLMEVVNLISSSSLAPVAKAQIKAALYLIDAISYISNAMTKLGNEAECQANLDVCQSVWFGENPASNIPDRLQPNAQTIRTIFTLAASADVQQTLRSEYLPVKDSNYDLLIALCRMDSNNRPFCLKEGTVTPSKVQQGAQGVTLTINSTNPDAVFPEDAKVEFITADGITIVPDSNQKLVQLSEDRKIITLVINVNQDAPADNPETANTVENIRSIRISSQEYGKFEVMLTDVLTILPAVPSEPTWAAATNYERAHDFLKFSPALQAGFSSMLWESNEMPYAMRPAVDIYATDFGIAACFGNPNNSDPNDDYVVVVGKDHPLAGDPVKWLEFMFNVWGMYNGAYHIDSDQTNRGEVGAGVLLRWHALSDGNLAFDAPYINYRYQGTDYQSPNPYFFSGDSHTLTSGLAISSQFGTDWMRARFFGEYQLNIVRWDAETDSHEFSNFDDPNGSVRTGIELIMAFSKMKENDSKWVPDLTLELAAVPWGVAAIPEFWPEYSGSAYENIWGLEGGARLSLGEIDPVRIYVAGEVNVYHQENWPYMYGGRGILGFDSKKAGVFEFIVGQEVNPALRFDQDLIYGSGCWTMPWANRTITLCGSGGAAGGQAFGGANVGLDILNFIGNFTH